MHCAERIRFSGDGVLRPLTLNAKSVIAIPLDIPTGRAKFDVANRFRAGDAITDGTSPSLGQNRLSCNRQENFARGFRCSLHRQFRRFRLVQGDDLYEAGEKMVKGLLVGTVAGLVATAGAQAADIPAKVKPVPYVKICGFTGTASTTFPAPTPASSWAGIYASRPNTMPAPAEPLSARARPKRRKPVSPATSPTTSTTVPVPRCRGTCARRPNTARCAPLSASASRSPLRRLPRPASCSGIGRSCSSPASRWGRRSRSSISSPTTAPTATTP